MLCDVLRGDGIEVVRIAFAAPEMNCHAESFVGTLKRECLNPSCEKTPDDQSRTGRISLKCIEILILWLTILARDYLP